MNAFDQAVALLGKMRGSRGSPSYHTYSDQLEVLMRAYLVPKEDLRWHELGLNGTQARLATLLHSRMGKVVESQAIMDALYFDRTSDEEPEQKILTVMVCHIRKKLKNTNLRIETIWSKGFSMVEKSKDAPVATFHNMQGANRHRPAHRVAA